jgi:hypothetical protein
LPLAPIVLTDWRSCPVTNSIWLTNNPLAEFHRFITNYLASTGGYALVSSEFASTFSWWTQELLTTNLLPGALLEYGVQRSIRARAYHRFATAG